MKLGKRRFMTFYVRYYADYTFEIVKICSWIVDLLHLDIQIIDFNSLEFEIIRAKNLFTIFSSLLLVYYQKGKTTNREGFGGSTPPPFFRKFFSIY